MEKFGLCTETENMQAEEIKPWRKQSKPRLSQNQLLHHTAALYQQTS
jgi:hypothetical protein